MAHGTRTIYLSGLNKGFGSKFQRMSPEEGRSVQRLKRRECDNKDEDNIANNVNSINSYFKTSQAFWNIKSCFYALSVFSFPFLFFFLCGRVEYFYKAKFSPPPQLSVGLKTLKIRYIYLKKRLLSSFFFFKDYVLSKHRQS